jgi:hypothetical protein
MIRAWLLVCAAFGCGRIGFAERSDAGDGVSGDGAGADGGIPNVGFTGQTATYVKASNTGVGDAFGFRVATSADGTIVAVAANLEWSAATGVDGNQADNSAQWAGAVYVVELAGTSWSQRAYIKASDTAPGASFGSSVALSADGSTLAVGAIGASMSGAVYVFTRTGGTYTQSALLLASNAEPNDAFGYALALSEDGNTLAASAVNESSAASGIDGNQADNSLNDSGAVYVFTRVGGTWSQQAYVKASNPGQGSQFGYSLALSGGGDTLAAGSPAELSGAIGIDGNQLDTSCAGCGAVYVFRRSGSQWAQDAYVKPSNTHPNEAFGWSVALDGDGVGLAVGAAFEKSKAMGIDGDQADRSAPGSGAVYAFVRDTAWAQQAYIKAINTETSDGFGSLIALSHDGNTLAVGATQESSNATGIGGDPFNNSAAQSGAAYVLVRQGTRWSHFAYVKATNTDAGDAYGAVALSRDASTLVVGAPQEASNATGIGGNGADNSTSQSGAAYVYR